MGTTPARHPGFVGRRRERDLLTARLDAAVAGHGSVVLLSGEPGIGKTRLAQQVATLAAEHGMACRWGRATDEEGAPPYWPVRQLLGGAAGLLDRPAAAPDRPEARQRFELFEAITAELTGAASNAGLLLVLDDLHWADSASLQLLEHLTRSVGSARLLVVATYRDTEVVGREALRHALAALAREDAVLRVRLVGLTDAEVREQLGQLLEQPVPEQVAAVVSRRSQGNPFFVAELAGLLGTGAGETELPEGAREAIRRRLDVLTAPCRGLLAAAAVLGAEPEPDALAAATGQPLEDVLAALDEAAAAGFVREPGRCRFSHDLVRETAWLEVPTANRMALHQRMADHLRARTDAPRRAAEVAHHCLEALPLGDPDAAAVWAERAGDAAMAQLAWEQAGQLYRRALDAGADLPPDSRVRLLMAQARALVRCNDIRPARDAVRAAAALARELPDRELLARATVILEGTGDFAWAPAGLPLASEALARLPAEDTPLRARVLAQVASDHSFVTMWQDRDQIAETLSSEALAMAERLGDHTALVAALRARQIVLGGPHGVAGRLRLAERMSALADRDGDPERELWGRVWRFDALVQIGRVDAAEAELAPLGAVVRRLRSPLAHWHLLRCRGAIEFGRGRFTAALATFEETLLLAERAGHRASLLAPLAMLTLTCAELGRTDLPPAAALAPPWTAEGVVGAEALWHLALGRRDHARRLYAGLPGPDRIPRYTLLPYLNGQAHLADAFTDPTMAAAVRARLTPFADLFICSGLGALGTAGSVRLPLGITAATLGRLDEAAHHLRLAVDANERAGLPPAVAHARFQLGRVLARRRRSGDREEAGALAASTAAMAERLGMRPLHTRACELIAALSDRRPGPLTAREHEVAALVGQGLTNRQIAAALHISDRTAENHVQHILTKLGFVTRTQIATWASSATLR